MNNKTILIPSDGTQRTEQIIDFICSIGNMLSLKIIVAYVIEVPRDMPLHSSIPGSDIKANDAIKHALSIAFRHDIRIETTKIFARNADDCIISTAQEMKCDIIALAHESAKYKFVTSPSMNIYQRAKCDVWLFNNKD